MPGTQSTPICCVLFIIIVIFGLSNCRISGKSEKNQPRLEKLGKIRRERNAAADDINVCSCVKPARLSTRYGFTLLGVIFNRLCPIFFFAFYTNSYRRNNGKIGQCDARLNCEGDVRAHSLYQSIINACMHILLLRCLFVFDVVILTQCLVCECVFW